MCHGALLCFPAIKKNDSKIKCKSEKNASETAHILEQDDKKLNSERSTKFEDKYSELEKMLIMESTTQDKVKKQMQKMKKGAQQLTHEEASMMPQQQIHQESKDTSLDESAIDAFAVANEGTAAADSQGRVNEDDADGMRSKKENVTNETIECKATATAACETEASAAATTKTYERTTADMQWGRRSDANDARRRRGKGEEVVEKAMESASARAANEKEEIAMESRDDQNEQRWEKDEEIKAHIEERKNQ